MDTGKKDADSTVHDKSTRKKGKAEKEPYSEAPTATGKDASKRSKKAAPKKRPGAHSSKGPSSAAEGPLPETTAAEHAAVETTAVVGRRQSDITQGTTASQATRAKSRDKDAGDKRKGRGVGSNSKGSALPPSSIKGPSLQPDVGSSQEVRASSDNGANPDAPRTSHQTAHGLKPSAAALPQLIGEAELSGGLSGEVVGNAPVSVLVIPAGAAPGARGKASHAQRSAQEAADWKYSALTEGSSLGASISEHVDIAARSDRRRSTLVKQHSAITERALRDRRDSTIPAKAGVFNNKAAIALCAITIVGGTLLLVLALYREPGILKNKVCETPACVEFSSRIRESLNASVEPCQDFAQFVCGGWGRAHELTVAEEALVAALRSMGNRLKDVSAPAAGKQDTTLKAHLLYRSCYSVLKGEKDELDDVRKALLEVGVVWPHTSPEPNVLSTVLRSSLTLHWGAPFDVTLKEANGALVVELEPYRMFGLVRDKFDEMSGDDQRRKAYFEVLKLSFKKNDENLLDFETVNGLDKGAFSSLPQKVEVSPDPVTLDTKLVFEGVEYVSPELWREVLIPYASAKNSNNILVKTRSNEFLMKIGELWAKYGKNNAHIFVSWCIVQTAALYANQKLQLNFYDTEDRAVLIQGSSCLARAFLIARSRVFAGYGDELLASRSRVLAYKLMVTVRHASGRRLRRWKGFNPNVTVLRKSSATEAVLHVLHAGFVPDGDNTAADMRDSLVYNWRNAPAPTTEAGPLRDVHAAIEAGQLLLLQEKDFVLMPYAFTFPYFDEGFTAALNYAGVGGIAAFAMANLYFEAYSKPTVVNSSLQEMLDCMSNSSVDAQDEAMAKLLMLQVLSSEASLDAYERHWASNDIPLTGLQSYSPLQLFFIASCYRLCAGGVHSAVRALCNEYLQHVEEFARAFNCPENSPMNPLMRCSLF